MALILVIESDRRQTSKLSILARNQLRADLLIVESVEQALDRLDECDPELILTSSAISGRDQLALGDRLRQLEKEGLRIQTVPIPVLGVAGQRSRIPQKSAPGRAPVPRGRPAQNEGMDPVVFGMQVAMHLERIVSERAASGVIVRRQQAAAVIIDEEELEAMEVIDEEAPAIDAPQTTEDPRSIEVPRPKETLRPTARHDWGELLDAMRREIEVAQSPALPRADQADSQLNLDEFARIIDGASDAPPKAEKKEVSDAAPRSASIENLTPAINPEAPDPAPAAAPAPAGKKAKKMRRVPPQDEFGFFDPRQCGLSALYAKLDTISPPSGKPSPKKPS